MHICVLNYCTFELQTCNDIETIEFDRVIELTSVYIVLNLNMDGTSLRVPFEMNKGQYSVM